MITNKNIKYVYWSINDNTDIDMIYEAIINLPNVKNLRIDVIKVTNINVILKLVNVITNGTINLSLIVSNTQWNRFSHAFIEYFDLITLNIENDFLRESIFDELLHLQELNKYIDLDVTINKKNYKEFCEILTTTNLYKIADINLKIDTFTSDKLNFIISFSNIKKKYKNIHIENRKKLLNKTIVKGNFNQLYINENGGIGMYEFLPVYETVVSNSIGSKWERYVKYFFYQDAKFYIAGYGMNDLFADINEIKKRIFNYGSYSQQIPKPSSLWELHHKEIVNRRTGEKFIINETGERIFQKINGKKSILSIIQELLDDRFPMEGTMIVKIIEYINMLENAGIIKVEICRGT